MPSKNISRSPWKRFVDRSRRRTEIDQNITTGYLLAGSIRYKHPATECQCKSGLPILAMLPVMNSDTMIGYCRKCKPKKENVDASR
jgi:hypothetical protein